MKIIVMLLLIALSQLSYSCADLVPGKSPVLKQFKSIIMIDDVQGNVRKGEAEALLSINENGEVTKAKLISVKPDSLNKDKILKEILRAKFSVSTRLEDYVHIFEFQVVQR
ncbi:hypothetical protein [Gilvimarinus sp. DA14]|uniref:hypothetical protein n=1 Tax=Gilvimarinus sp. DA14 TaxID=2956798 RepID=UPI0020B8D5C5|nr:hypothetical protein [Gilvimarinus sp. DA14]UTF61839.1 hypothetical protein NHM04_08620 [Gilvimarinus sp. DA14]